MRRGPHPPGWMLAVSSYEWLYVVSVIHDDCRNEISYFAWLHAFWPPLSYDPLAFQVPDHPRLDVCVARESEGKGCT
jgi:hypothetical protein